jgi:hypothetical protein
MQSPAILTSLIAVLAGAQAREPLQPSSNAGVRAVGLRPTADTARTVRAARRAQQQFESLRRANLPFRPGPPRGPCDVRIGRFCYWHDDGASPLEVPEPEPIARARDRLLATLAAATRLIGGEEWVVGQRVRYLLEARRSADAIAAAADCSSAEWWCDALAGLALHQAGEYARADSAFARALAQMPANQRCRWTDISLFLDGEAAKQYRRLPCPERAGFERRFWWLSQPLYSMPGNDLRTEFFARRTMSRLEQQARSAYNLSWGSDVDELLMRFGWPTWWTRDHSPSAYGTAVPSIVGHEPTPSFFFHPAERLLLAAHPADALPGDWQPTMRLPTARYAPPYAASFSELLAQIAVFRRGDSAIVVASYEPPRDSLFDEGIGEAALALGVDEGTPMTVVRQRLDHGRADPLIARTAWAPMLASVELTAPKRRGVARARFGIRPSDPLAAAAGRLSLSDIILYRGVDTAAASLEDIIPYALGATRIPTRGRVGVYWELYGLKPAGEPLAVTLTVERVRVGWGRRAAERLGLAAKSTPLRVRWHEVPKRDSGIASRAIMVDLSALPAGRYRMQLAVAAADGSTAVSERSIELFEAR